MYLIDFALTYFLSQGSKNFVDIGKWDTVLTGKGIEQAQALRSKMAGIVDQIDVVISSPLSRALHTSELVFGESIPKEKKIVHPLLTERVYLSSDVGKQRETLQSIYPNWNYDHLVRIMNSLIDSLPHSLTHSLTTAGRQ